MDGEIVLGKKLNNPYTVENMTKAYESLRARQAGGQLAVAAQVRATHRYVRFLPESWEEYEVLKADASLKLYETPLDYEITSHGWHYHDPSVPDGRPTWQYTAVPISYAFPSRIHHEILAELYIPELDPALTEAPDGSSQAAANAELTDALLDEAMLLTGNFDEVTKPVSAAGYNPSGTIRVFDTHLGRLIPLEGVKVRARRWFTIREVLTDANGSYFIHKRFDRPVNYALFYERADFDIRSGTFGQAWLDGPKQSGPWNVDLWDGTQRFYATILRAAVDYYYGSRFGLASPPQNNFWRPALKIAAYDKDRDDSNGQTHPWSRTLGLFSTIDIYNPNRATDQLYGTAIHEIAHYSHWGIDRSAYNDCADQVAESWARGVQWVMTNQEYASLGALGYNHFSGWQNLSTADSGEQAHMRSGYTPVVIDLLDQVNQRATHGGSTNFVDDRVSDFAIREVEDALVGTRNLDDWKDKLKSLNRVPAQDLDTLFNFYKNL